jgi:hypothetical protein
MREEAARDQPSARLLDAEDRKRIAMFASDNRPNVGRAGQRLLGFGPFTNTGHRTAALPATDF